MEVRCERKCIEIGGKRMVWMMMENRVAHFHRTPESALSWFGSRGMFFFPLGRSSSMTMCVCVCVVFPLPPGLDRYYYYFIVLSLRIVCRRRQIVLMTLSRTICRAFVCVCVQCARFCCWMHLKNRYVPTVPNAKMRIARTHTHIAYASIAKPVTTLAISLNVNQTNRFVSLRINNK